MSPLSIPHQRLLNQRLTGSSFTQAQEIVSWFGAIQAQDFAAGKWALGLRAPGLTDTSIEQAFNAGVILRTHILRPTWHFVAPADLRWMLALTGPRVNAFNASYYRKFGLDDETFRYSHAALEKTLQGGKALTRPELETALQQAGVNTDDLRSTLLVMRAELDGVLCSGPRLGKQFTYMLLEERVPPTRKLERDEALAELTRRYFTSHGPATLADFAWWSGLTLSDARSGLEAVKTQLASETVRGQTYWFDASAPTGRENPQQVYLLPNFDEYTVAYTDRSAISVGVDLAKLDPRSEGILNYVIVIDGQFAGNWKRVIKKNEIIIELHPFAPLTDAEQQAIVLAADRYGAFLGLPVVLKFM
jgi:hypothetical protein